MVETHMITSSKQPKENLIQFIKNSDWVFASTYAKTWPHEYIVEGNVDGDLFLVLSQYIDSYGCEGNFYETKQMYFEYGKYTYWHMENIINRCLKKDTYSQRLKDGLLPGTTL